MNLQQKAVKGVIWTTLQNWGGQALFFVTFLILARLLGPATFGLVSMANVFIHFVQALLGQSFADAIVQRKELEPEHLDTAFWSNVAIGVGLFAIGLISAPWIAIAFKQPELTPIIRYLAFSVVLNALSSTHQAILRRQLNFKDLAIRQLAGQSIGCIVAVTLAFSGFGVWSIVHQQIVSNLVGTILLWRMVDWTPRFRFSGRHLRELMNFGINVVGMNILVFISLRSDDLLIGYYLGPVALGYYTVAYRLLVTLTQLLTDTVRQVVLPVFSKLQDNPEKMRQAFYSATELVSFVAMPAFVGMAILAPELVFGLFGSEWEPSIPVMQLLAFVGLLRSLFNFSGAVIMSAGKPSWNLGLMTLDTLAKVLAFLIAVRWGINAVALGLLIATYAFAPIRLWVIKRLIHLNIIDYLSRYVPPLLSSVVMTGSIFLCKWVLTGRMDIRLLLGLYVIVGAISYLLSLYLISPDLIRKLKAIAHLAKPSALESKA